MKHDIAGSTTEAGAFPLGSPEALFRAPRPLHDAAWTVHVPFAFWLVETCRPARIVDLAVARDGAPAVSRAAFAQAASEPGVAIPDLAAAPADAADFADAGIDLLHVDLQAAPAPLADLVRDWTPKLSPRGVLLIHGAADPRPADAAVLASIRARHRCLALEAGAGLTAALVGASPPERLRALAEAGPAQAAALALFERLGRGWLLEARDLARALRLEALEAEIEAGRTEAEAAQAKAREEATQRRRVERELVLAQSERRKLETALADTLAYGLDLEKRHHATLRSTSWRAMEPVRRILQLARGRRMQPPFVPRLDAGILASAKGKSQRGVDARRARISRAFDKARGPFRAAGLAELEAIGAEGNLDSETRRRAAFGLALLRAESGDASERARALAGLEATPAAREGPRGPAEVATLRLALLLGLGRVEDASRLAAAPPGEAAAHPDFLLLAAALAPLDAGSGPDRIAAVSAAVRASSGLGIVSADMGGGAAIDNLHGDGPLAKVRDAMKISVIVPAFDCADTIRTSLRSISRQTWDDLEILVADDASSDGTREIVAELAERDPRIRLIRLPRNGGAYVARNTALAEAQGDLVTCQDADDWSHPERLRRQAEHLRANPHLVANVSHWARATPDLVFERRPFSARVIHFNSSSIMFRRAAVLEGAGFWDSVRFGGDTEFWHRLMAVFGDNAVAELPEMLAIGRIRDGSLSRATASAYLGGKTGARKVYDLAFRAWHAQTPSKALRLPFPLETRPFAVPSVMRTGRSVRGHFDAVLISDFRHMGGTTASNQQELIAQSRAGLRTAVVQVDRYDFNVSRGVHPDIQELIDAGAVEQLVYGDSVTTDVAVVRFPPIFSHLQAYLPEIRPRSVRVVVNQPPRRVANEAPFYAIEACKANIAAYLGQPGDWVPIGPAVRHALEADGEAHHLTPEDWFNIIDVDAWRVERDGWRGPRAVIGRHGRDAPEKWLTKAEDLTGAYPDDGSVLVRIMGGADVPIRTLGRRPAHWEVLEFNALPPRDFLATLDFFVFFPHEGRIEAFGRTVIEAIASGCVAILPPVFEPLFGPAALYCAPGDVGGIVAALRADRSAYLAQTARAEALVRARFGFEQHVARLSRAMAAAPALSDA